MFCSSRGLNATKRVLKQRKFKFGYFCFSPTLARADKEKQRKKHKKVLMFIPLYIRVKIKKT